MESVSVLARKPAAVLAPAGCWARRRVDMNGFQPIESWRPALDREASSAGEPPQFMKMARAALTDGITDPIAIAAPALPVLRTGAAAGMGVVITGNFGGSG